MTTCYKHLNFIHIVGCGLIGSNLAIKLCLQNICKKLYLYDDDTISEDNKKYYPFIHHSGMNIRKTLFIKNFIQKLKILKSPIIYTFEKKISKKIKNYNIIDLVIDCRDNKKIDINPDIRCSMDGPLLLIDCRKKTKYTNSVTTYILEKEIKDINLAISIILKYLIERQYKQNKLVYYNMQNFLSQTTRLL